LTLKKELIKRISRDVFKKGNLLDLGCGTMPYKKLIIENSEIIDYTGVDIENPIYQNTQKPDCFWDGFEVPLESSTFDNAILIEVLEHMPKPDNTLKELSRLLKKDGNLLITVPFLWTLHDVPNDEFRYTPFALKRMLEENNFEVINLESFNNWHGSMALMLALYARRGCPAKFRKIFSFFIFPVVKYLMKKDSGSNKAVFNEGQMITGIWCLAKRK
jgi:SAM-dependent methyltransferase